MGPLGYGFLGGLVDVSKLLDSLPDSKKKFPYVRNSLKHSGEVDSKKIFHQKIQLRNFSPYTSFIHSSHIEPMVRPLTDHSGIVYRLLSNHMP